MVVRRLVLDRPALHLVLRADGYDVVTAAGQEEAEEKLLSVRPDLCVVDLMMENMDSGFVLCHNIKRLYPDSPVILLTAVRSSTKGTGST